MREWNPLWADPEGLDNPAYLASIKRIIVTGINWIEAHPQFRPEWREPNKRALMRKAGLPDDIPESAVAVTAAWEDYYLPGNSHTRQWFRAMASACAQGDPDNQPSALMLGKGIACGCILILDGWDAFDRFMLERHDGPGH